jgi:dimethylglycine catabolism A
MNLPFGDHQMNALFEPGQIGPIETPNRIVMPAMTTRLAEADGQVTDATIAYFTARAAGGVGLVTVEMAAPEAVGRHRLRELGLYDDRFLSGLRRLVEALHAAGARASIQLGHGGGHTRVDICGEAPIAPSAVPHFVYEVTGETIVPLEMTAERIAETTRAYIAAAARAKQAGFDCVEVHGAHGYLISQFLTPEENTRDDDWGGSLENRARFGLDIVRGIKDEVPGIGVIFRFNADDFFPGGIDFKDARRIAVWAAESGADAIHVTAGHYRSLPSAERMIPPMAYPDATFLDYAATIRSEVLVPVIAVGRLGDPAIAAAALNEGKADFIALGRPLLADPLWPATVRAGHTPRRCLACNSCVNDMRGGTGLRCLVNPATGRELKYDKNTGPNGERIAVIGAGPAGLTYADLVAKENQVTIFERAGLAGGAFRLAGKAPRFQEVETSETSLTRYIEALVQRCTEQGVEIRYDTNVEDNPSQLTDFDRIVIASGADYRTGLALPARLILTLGLARLPLFKRLFSSDDFRDRLYHRWRSGTGARLSSLISSQAHAGQTLQIIGDAAQAGKSAAAIESAFEAAYSR